MCLYEVGAVKETRHTNWNWCFSNSKIPEGSPFLITLKCTVHELNVNGRRPERKRSRCGTQHCSHRSLPGLLRRSCPSLPQVRRLASLNGRTQQGQHPPRVSSHFRSTRRATAAATTTTTTNRVPAAFDCDIAVVAAGIVVGPSGSCRGGDRRRSCQVDRHVVHCE